MTLKEIGHTDTDSQTSCYKYAKNAMKKKRYTALVVEK